MHGQVTSRNAVKQSTPRKGTETPRRWSAEYGTGNNLHLARGRKQSIDEIFGGNLHETTYTPQGDGNPFHPFRAIRLPLKQPTPRKGTETSFLRHECIRSPETTYTPQGDILS